MENDQKLKVLAAIARRLNEAGVTWAVGGSMLLYFKHMTDEFHDIDLLVTNEDAETAKAILLDMGTPVPSKPKPQYKTKTFLEFYVDGAEVDVMAGFAIVKDGTEHDCSLKKDDIQDYAVIENEKIPLHSVALWRRYYTLMGKESKVRMIDGLKD